VIGAKTIKAAGPSCPLHPIEKINFKKQKTRLMKKTVVVLVLSSMALGLNVGNHLASEKPLGWSMIYTDRNTWEAHFQKDSDDGKKYLFGSDIVLFVRTDGTLEMTAADQFKKRELKKFIRSNKRKDLPQRNDPMFEHLVPGRGFL